MSVMSCIRNDCENVMCDTYIPSMGYICWECKKEFKEFIKGVIPYPRTEGEIQQSLGRFMSTPKGSYLDKEMDVEDFFQQYTKDD